MIDFYWHAFIFYQKALHVSPNDFGASLDTLLRTMSWQAHGIPSGNHGLFYKYRIEAYTLKGVAPNVGEHRTVDIEAIGRLLTL